MAGKFMRVKRMVLPFITLVFLASQLAGCAALNSQEFLAEAGKVDEVVIEYNELEESESPEQSKGIEGYITQSQQTGVSEEEADIGVIGDSEVVSTRKPTQEELNGFFERAYVSGDDLRDIFEDEDEMIAMEMNELTYILTVERADLETPADLESQYRAWRAEAHPATSTQAPPQAEMQLFAECNEVVYALDQVNIRASYSTSSTRLGSLTRGQSITRIGTAIPGTEAEGWSRVQLSDGTIAYMVSSYLSTSKPQQQGNQNRTPQPGTGTQQTGGGTYTPPPGQAGNPTWDADSLFTDPFKGLTEEEKQALIEEGHRITEKAVEGSTSIFHPG